MTPFSNLLVALMGLSTLFVGIESLLVTRPAAGVSKASLADHEAGDTKAAGEDDDGDDLSRRDLGLACFTGGGSAYDPRTVGFELDAVTCPFGVHDRETALFVRGPPVRT